MHNIELICQNLEIFIQNISKRGVSDEMILKIRTLPSLNLKRKENINLTQNLEQKNNLVNSKLIPPLKKKERELPADQKVKDEISSLVGEVEKNNLQIKIFENELSKIESEIKFITEQIPNLSLGKASENFMSEILIPIGGEDQNLEIRKHGEPREFDFKPLTHEEIGVKMKQMDFEQTAKISGSRFVSFSGKIAKLEKALTNFMIDLHTKEHGYELFSIPFMVRNHAMYGVGQLPKFSEQSFVSGSGPESFENDSKFSEKETYRLIPTAEVSLTNLVREKILKHEELPIRMVTSSPCFRSEIGSSGRDVSGIIRMHQFLKVELVSITDSTELEKTVDSDHISFYEKNDINQINCEHERMSFAASKVLELLGLPYRVLLLASDDMGFASRKTYDFEVWMPSQNKYREISSCSYCGDFQGRRMNSRYKSKIDGKNYFVHTLNGSALAVGRTMAAIIENFQTKDGDFEIPEVLKKYF